MKTSRHTEPQILSILRQVEGVRLEASGGMPVAGLGLEHGMGRASFYKRRARDGCAGDRTDEDDRGLRRIGTGGSRRCSPR